MTQPSAILLDCTLRDSGYANHFQFTARDTRRIAGGLERAGISHIEVGHGLGLGASSVRYGVAFESDVEYVAAARSATDHAQIGAFFIPGVGTIEHMKLAADAGLDFVRIGNNVTTWPDIRPYVDAALELGLAPHVNLMKSYAASPVEMAEIARGVASWNVASLYVVDSAGCMLPDEVSAYIGAIRDHSDLVIGFHGHNNLCVANANCLAALSAGATYVDGTLRGMGRSAGNAHTEILAHLLPKAGHEIGVDPFVLFELAEKYLVPLMLYEQGLDTMDVVIGMSRFHSSFMPRFKRACDRYDVDLRRLIIEVSAIDCVDPPQSLIDDVAHDLNRTATDP